MEEIKKMINDLSDNLNDFRAEMIKDSNDFRVEMIKDLNDFRVEFRKEITQVKQAIMEVDEQTRSMDDKFEYLNQKLSEHDFAIHRIQKHVL